MRPSQAITNRSSLFGYAVLRANFNQNAPDYLDNFASFVLDVLAERHPESLSECSAGELIRDTFGLTIPDRVVGVLLRRAVKSGSIASDGRGNYSLSSSTQASRTGLRESISSFESQQSELRFKFAKFVAEHHADKVGLVDGRADAVIQSFIERHAAPLLRRAVQGTSTSNRGVQWSDLQGVDYLIADFILFLDRSDAQALSYLVNAVKGAILAGVLQLGRMDLHKRLRDVTLILDTPVMLKALGYHGQSQQLAVTQTLALAQRQGARTVCFEHSLSEVDGVLESVIPVLRSRAKGASPLREVDIHFLDSSASAADIVVHQHSLRNNLQLIGVSVIDRPGEYYRYGLDEESLDAVLKEHMPFQRQGTRAYDVSSLSAIHRLRHGTSPESFELCRFVLVTDNYALVSAARSIEERHKWPLAMLDSAVAALLWVRSPAIADNLPEDQLKAMVYAGMQPSGYLWIRYVEEIERLEKVAQSMKMKQLFFDPAQKRAVFLWI